MQNKCVGLAGFIFGHNFEARFNTQCGEGKYPLTQGSIESQILSTDPERLVSLVGTTKSTKTEYAYDICLRCGLIVKENA